MFLHFYQKAHQSRVGRRGGFEGTKMLEKNVCVMDSSAIAFFFLGGN
jgi:hypothetical protein